ncbi:3125_t:CDS:1, partial [Gigaspora rosea]
HVKQRGLLIFPLMIFVSVDKDLKVLLIKIIFYLKDVYWITELPPRSDINNNVFNK